MIKKIVISIICIVAATYFSEAGARAASRFEFQRAPQQKKYNISAMNRKKRQQIWRFVFPVIITAYADNNNKLSALAHGGCYEDEPNNKGQVIWPYDQYAVPENEKFSGMNPVWPKIEGLYPAIDSSLGELKFHQFFNKGTSYYVGRSDQQSFIKSGTAPTVEDVIVKEDYCATPYYLVEHFCIPLIETFPSGQSYPETIPYEWLHCGEKVWDAPGVVPLQCTGGGTSKYVIDCGQWDSMCKDGACVKEDYYCKEHYEGLNEYENNLGIRVRVAGSDETFDVPDSCAGSNVVAEKKCGVGDDADKQGEDLLIECPKDYYCSDGKCVFDYNSLLDPDPKPTCEDIKAGAPYNSFVNGAHDWVIPGDWHYSVCKDSDTVTHFICDDGSVTETDVDCSGGSQCLNGLCNDDLDPFCIATNPSSFGSEYDPTKPGYAWSGTISGISESEVSQCDYMDFNKVHGYGCYESEFGFTLLAVKKTCPQGTICVNNQDEADYCHEIIVCDDSMGSTDPTKYGYITVIGKGFSKVAKNSCGTSQDSFGLPVFHMEQYVCQNNTLVKLPPVECPEDTHCEGKSVEINGVPGNYFSYCVPNSDEDPPTIPEETPKLYSCMKPDDPASDPTVPGKLILTKEGQVASTLPDQCSSTGSVRQFTCLTEQKLATNTDEILDTIITPCPQDAPTCVTDLDTGISACVPIPGCIDYDPENKIDKAGTTKILTDQNKYELFEDFCDGVTGILTQYSCGLDDNQKPIALQETTTCANGCQSTKACEPEN